MCTKKIMVYFLCLSGLISQNLSADHGLGSINDKILYGNSPWGGKIAQSDYKKKKIDTQNALLEKVDSILKNIETALEYKTKQFNELENSLVSSPQDAKQKEDEMNRLTHEIEFLSKERESSKEKADALFHVLTNLGEGDAFNADRIKQQRLFYDSLKGDLEKKETLIQSKQKEFEAVKAKRKELLDSIAKEGETHEKKQKIEDLTSELKALKENRKNLKTQYDADLASLMTSLKNDDFVNDPWGTLIAKALAGPNNNSMFDEAKIEDWWDGTKKGGTVLMVGALSESLRGKAKAVADESVGSMIDFFIAKIKDFASMVRNVLFHDCNAPFDHLKLDGWQKILMAAFDDIDQMLKNGLRDSTRGLDSVSRQFDDSNSDEPVKKDVDMWASLAAGYAEQFAYFISVFEQHKEYYEEDDIVVFYANQICQMLQATRKLLLCSKSLKDLDTKLESQKTIIPAFKKNIFNLFDQLKAEVKPRSYSSKDSTTSSAISNYKPNAYNSYSNAGGYGNDYPTAYSSYAGI